MKSFEELRSVIETVLVILKHQDPAVEETAAVGLNFDAIYSFMPFQLVMTDQPSDRMVECSNSLGNSRFVGGSYTNDKPLFQHCATVTLNYHQVKYVLKIFHHKIHICGVQNDQQIGDLLDFFVDNIIDLQNLSTDLAEQFLQPQYITALDQALRQWPNTSRVRYRHLKLLLQESSISELKVRALAYQFALEYHHVERPGRRAHRLHKLRYRLTPEGREYFDRLESLADRRRATDEDQERLAVLTRAKGCFGARVYQRLSRGLTNEDRRRFFEPVDLVQLFRADHEEFGVVADQPPPRYLIELIDSPSPRPPEPGFDSGGAPDLLTRAYDFYRRLRDSFPTADDRFAAFATGVIIYPPDVELDRIVPLMVNYRFYLDDPIPTSEIIRRLERARLPVYYNNTITNCVRVFVPFRTINDQVYIKSGVKATRCTVFNIYPGRGRRDLITTAPDHGPYIMQSSPNREEAKHAYQTVIGALMGPGAPESGASREPVPTTEH